MEQWAEEWWGKRKEEVWYWVGVHLGGMGHIPCYKALAPSLLPEDISNKALYGEMNLNSPYMYCMLHTYTSVHLSVLSQVHLCATYCRRFCSHT